MELRKIASKKPVKLLTLLLTAMLIATASAAVYYSLSTRPTVTIDTPAVTFVNGADSVKAGVSITDGTWATMAVKAYPNATLTYEKAINLTSNDGQTHDFTLHHVDMIGNGSVTPASNNFTFINFTVVNAAGSELASFDYYINATGGWEFPSDTGTITVPATGQLTIKVETKAKSGADTGYVVNITIEVKVNE